MKTPAYIKILKGLPLAIAMAGERELFKAFETLFILKSVYVDRPMPVGSTTDINHLANISLRSTKTIQRRIAQLLTAGLLKRDGSGLVAISWDDLRERYSIKHEHFYHITLQASVKLEYIIKSKVFQDKQEHCRLGFIASRERNRIKKEVLQQVSASVQADEVAKHQLDCFYSEGRAYNGEIAYALNTYYVDKKEKIMRGDLNLCSRTISRIFGYKGHGSVAKLKRYLMRNGVITFAKRVIDLVKHTHTTTDSRITRLGFVKWNPDEYKVQLIMPDEITVTPLKHIERNYNRMQSLLSTTAANSAGQPQEGGANV